MLIRTESSFIIKLIPIKKNVVFKLFKLFTSDLVYSLRDEQNQQ